MASGNRLEGEVATTHPEAAPFWEPLVQGRTYELEYSVNYLAVPRSFGLDDLEWARRFVKGSRLSPVESVLKRMVRFCLFKDRGYCVVGVSLPAGMICDDENKTRDISGKRENYVFLGCVVQCDQKLFPDPPHHPGIPQLDALRRHLREVFGPLYENFIVARYDEKPLPGNRKELLAIRSEPRVLFPPDLPLVTSALAPFVRRRRDEQVTVWPPSSEAQLWAAACLAEPPASLCLSIAKESDAHASGFDHVTIWDTHIEKILAPTVAPPPSPVQSRRSQDPAARHSERRLQFRAFGRKIIITIECFSKAAKGSLSPEGQPRGSERGLP
jgi:hypothetical protein